MGTIRFFAILLLLFSGINKISAQVKVDYSKNIFDAVKSLEGPGVKISNITTSIPLGSTPIAYFEDNINFTGISKGILLTTGSAHIAEGPNGSAGAGQSNGSTFQDPLLRKLADTIIFDFCFIEFDIITSSSTLSFDYVFASEEYPEFPGYSDVFALTIAGPGISGTKNLAVVPGTNLPVSVSNIREGNNEQYYRDNWNFPNHSLEYDGLTVVLTASTEVLPCQTYRIRLAIADAIDAVWDSGVFIKQGSFKSEDPPIISVVYEHPEFDYAIEECNNAIVKFERPASMSDTVKLVYSIIMTGTAVNGTDYKFIADSLVIPEGEKAGYIFIEPLADNLSEGEEKIQILIANSCPQFPTIASFEFPLREKFPYSIPSESICFKETVQLNKNPEPETSIMWENNSNLSCTNCLSPVLNPDHSEYISYTITHTTSGCQAKDSLLVSVTNVTPDFNFHSDECYTSADIIFNNNTSDATHYLWDFGDGEQSEEAHPIHTYPANKTKGSVQYIVKLTASSSSPSCREEVSKTITITDPLFIPNLITADNNGKNEEFRISGIGGQCWTLYLYNRWGTLVYKKENYTDEFKGIEVTSGNYYYLIENGNKDRSFSGWIHIIHNIE